MLLYIHLFVSLLFSSAAVAYFPHSSRVTGYTSGDCSGKGERVYPDAPIHNCLSFTIDNGFIDICSGFEGEHCTGCKDFASPNGCFARPLSCWQDKT